MMRAAVVACVLLVGATSARADGRGQAVFAQKCARCHIVGRGQPVPKARASLVDLTLVAKRRDAAWLSAFVQKPVAIAPDTACRAQLDAATARHVVHFLRDRLRPVAPTAGATVPPATPMKPAPPRESPKPPAGMVRR
jgi:mono/diheme cytochrome c family protein